MKITRLKKGYRITLSDSDMSMLRWIVIDGESSWEGQEEHEQFLAWSPAAKAAYTRRNKGGHVLRTDEDRR